MKSPKDKIFVTFANPCNLWYTNFIDISLWLLIIIESQAGLRFVWKLLVFVRLGLIGIVVRFILLTIIVSSDSKHNLHFEGWFVRFDRPGNNFLLIDNLFRLVELLFKLHLENVRILHLRALDFYFHDFLDLKIRESLKLFRQFLFSAVEHLQSHHFFIQKINRRLCAQTLNSHTRKLFVTFIELLLIAEDDEDSREGPTSLFW